MALPELDIARVQRWCTTRVPEHALHQVRVECQIAPRHLTIVERRTPWREEFGPEWTRFPIARLRSTRTSKTWSLLWRDRNLRFHEYDRLASSERVDDLLSQIERDPTAIFLGVDAQRAEELDRRALAGDGNRGGRGRVDALATNKGLVPALSA